MTRLAVIGSLSALALAACGGPQYPASRVRVYPLPSGESVTCVVIGANGISCDWAGAR